MYRPCNIPVINAYFDELTACNYAQNTLKSYRAVVAAYVLFLRSKRKTLINANRADICAYRTSIDTIAKRKLHITVIRQLHLFTQSIGARPDNPAAFIKCPRTHTVTHKKRISPETITRLTAFCRTDTEHLLILLLYTMALRVSEACSMTKNDICTDTNTITVIGKGNKRRDIQTNDHIIRSLLFYARENECHMLTGYKKQGLSTVHAWRVLTALCARANIDRLTPHALRHARAEHLRAQGIDPFIIQTLLGHSKISMTSLYVNPVVYI